MSVIQIKGVMYNANGKTVIEFQQDANPAPTQTPTPTPTPAPAPVTPGGAVSMEALRAHAVFRGERGVIYSFQLPQTPNMEGLVQVGGDPETEDELTIRLTISNTPGDTGYWKTAPFPSGRGMTYYPAKQEGDAKAGLQIQWGLVGAIDRATVSRGQWFLNVEFVNKSGVFVYFHAAS